VPSVSYELVFHIIHIYSILTVLRSLSSESSLSSSSSTLLSSSASPSKSFEKKTHRPIRASTKSIQANNRVDCDNPARSTRRYARIRQSTTINRTITAHADSSQSHRLNNAFVECIRFSMYTAHTIETCCAR
jgi:hypothetical protein